MKKVNVLGEDYTVEMIDEKDEAMIEACSVGYCDKTSKRIVVLNTKKETPNDFDKPEVFNKSTARHEMIHAFLYESGIEKGTMFHNEQMVDWVAEQVPKMIKAFNEIGAL